MTEGEEKHERRKLMGDMALMLGWGPDFKREFDSEIENLTWLRDRLATFVVTAADKDARIAALTEEVSLTHKVHGDLLTTMQNDLRDLLRALGMFDGARPDSPQVVMRLAIHQANILRESVQAVARAVTSLVEVAGDMEGHHPGDGCTGDEWAAEHL